MLDKLGTYGNGSRPQRATTAVMPSVSQQNWHGLQPQRFRGSIKHISYPDQMGKVLLGLDPPVAGRKHFEEKFSNKIIWRPSIRPEQERKLQSRIFEDTNHITKLLKIPFPKVYRREKLKLAKKLNPDSNPSTAKMAPNTFGAVHGDDDPRIPQSRPHTSKSQKSTHALRLLSKEQVARLNSLLDVRETIEGSYNDAIKDQKKIYMESLKKELGEKGMPWKQKDKIESMVDDQLAIRNVELWEKTVLRGENPKVQKIMKEKNKMKKVLEKNRAESAQKYQEYYSFKMEI